jgi:hypothetical protein
VRSFDIRFEAGAALALAVLLASRPTAWAQQSPHIGYVYPGGGRQGTTFAAVLGGQYLNEATNVFVSGTGVGVSILYAERQLTPKEQKELKERLDELRKRRKAGTPLTAEETKSIEDIKTRLTRFGRNPANPALGEFVRLRITVATDAAPGERDLRLRTRFGLSNPLKFEVGPLPEFSLEPWRNVPKEAFSTAPQIEPAPPPVSITLPATINGQIPPGAVHRYRFSARAGQHIVIAARARDLIPYLADAVPGWFQALLTLYDPQGEEMACADHYRFHQDPVIGCRIPKSGEYTFSIRDSLYRGREDFVYRITVGERPFVTGIFPMGGRAGERTVVSVQGWNLPSDQQGLDLRDQAPGIYPFSVGAAGAFSPPVPFSVDTLPEGFEKEPNDTLTNAQAVALPVILNGRIDRPGDEDVFRFEGHGGDRLVAEVDARRLDSPLDSTLRATDATGRLLAFNDDHEDKGSGLNTHHADSYLAVTLPADGVYGVQLRDVQDKGGPAYRYRLRLSPPRPDFALRVAPSSLSVRSRASAPLTVYVLRQDGFDGAVALSLRDAPPGFQLTATPAPTNQDQIKLTLNATAGPAAEPVALRIEGRSILEGRETVRPAVPAEDMMQAFAYRHLVPVQELRVAVIGRSQPRDAARVLSATPAGIPAGGTARIEAQP